MNEDNLTTEVIRFAKYLSDRKKENLVSEAEMLSILYHATTRKAISLGKSWNTTRRDYKEVNDLLREKIGV
jgi:hypothetical protein